MRRVGFFSSTFAVLAGMGANVLAGAPSVVVTPRPAQIVPGMGGRSRSRNRYSGAELRRIRASGQARECTRRLRQKAARS
jgi:hypothetical protein